MARAARRQQQLALPPAAQRQELNVTARPNVTRPAACSRDAALAERTSCGGCFPRTHFSRRRCCRCTGSLCHSLRAACGHTRSSSASRGLSFSSLSAAVIGFRSAAAPRNASSASLGRAPLCGEFNCALQGGHRHHAVVCRSIRAGAAFPHAAPRRMRCCPAACTSTALALRWATPAASCRPNGAKVPPLDHLTQHIIARRASAVEAISHICWQIPSSFYSDVIHS